MKVLVQHLETGLYLRSDGAWVSSVEEPLVFPEAVTAISFCIRHETRRVRLVPADPDRNPQSSTYPFGNDPAISQERKNLRKAMAERKLK